MSSANLYPGGVILSNKLLPKDKELNEKLIIQRPNNAIVDFYNEHPDLNAFEDKKRLFEIVIPLYKDFYRFLNYQLKFNRHIHGTNQAFLIDTLRYIKTGKRNMELVIWKSILDEYPDITAKKERVEDMYILEHLEYGMSDSIDKVDYLIEWTSHSNGLRDMLCTSYFLFGKYTTSKVN